MFGRKNKNLSTERRPSTDFQARQKVFSYYASRSVSDARTGRKEPHDGSQRTWTHRLQQLPIFAAVAMMIFALLYSLMLTTSPRIMLVDETESSLAHSSEEYQRYAAQMLGSSVLNRTKLTINTSAVAAKIKQNYPEIVNVTVNLPLLGTRPIVQIETVKPSYIVKTASNQDYYLTPQGTLTSPAVNYETKPQNLPIISDQSGLEAKPGSQISTSDGVSFIREVVIQLSAKGLKISSLSLVSTPYDLWVYVEGVPYYVKFNTQGDPRQQAGTYLATRDYLTGKQKTPVSYIDVRAEDKAYFK